MNRTLQWAQPSCERPDKRRHWRLRSLGMLPALVAAVGWAGGATAASSPGAADPATPEVTAWKQLSLEELMNLQVKDVTTASRRSEKATEAPGMVVVIDRRDIQLRGYRFLSDVLRDLPGMETAPMYFSEVGTLVPVRGVVGNNKIVVLVNGMRVNPPGGENFPFRSDFSVRDAEQIEIIYGPGSTLYGQDAISAVINVKTRRPTANPSGSIGADGGLHRERDAWVSYSDSYDPTNRIRFLGYATYHDSDLMRTDREYRDYWSHYRGIADSATPPGRGVEPERQDLGVNVFARVEMDDRASVQLWHRQSERSSAEGGYGYVDGGRFYPVLHYLDEASWGDMSTVAEGKFLGRISDGAELDSTLTYNRYEIDPSTRYVWWSASGASTNWFFDDYKYGIGEGVTLDESLRCDLSPDLSMLAGVSAGAYNVIPKSTVPGGADRGGDVTGQGGYWEYYTVYGDVHSLQRIPRVERTRYRTYAGYLEFGWQALDKMRLIAGTRLTKDTRFDQIPVTPRAAVVYDLTKEITAKYIFTKAYVAPASYFSDATYDNGTVLATSNPDIDPETSLTHEVNLTYNRPTCMVGISGYYGEQDNLILISDTAAPQNTIAHVWVGPSATDPRLLAHSANGGSSERVGADVYGRVTFGPVSTWASYSYVDFHQDVPVGTSGLQGISRHNGRLGATWAVTSRLFVTPSLVMRTTPQNVFAGDLDDELTNPWDVNLYALWNVSKRVDLFADLRNVTDNRNALGGIAGSAYPQESFSGVIGAQVNF